MELDISLGGTKVNKNWHYMLFSQKLEFFIDIINNKTTMSHIFNMSLNVIRGLNGMTYVCLH
jgi:hypothetical protein